MTVPFDKRDQPKDADAKLLAKVAEFVVREAKSTLDPEKIVIFGSRSPRSGLPIRRDSDFDIAVFAPEASNEAWSRFALEIEGRAPTLHKIDLVRASPDLSQALRDNIQAQGTVLYERHA